MHSFSPHVQPQSLQIWLKSDRGEIEVYLCPEDESTECSSPVRSSSMDEGRGESLSQSTHPSTHPSTHHRTSGSKSFAENVDPQSSPAGSTSSPITGLTGSPVGGRRKSSRQRKPTAVIREAAAIAATMTGVKRKIKMDPDSEEEDTTMTGVKRKIKMDPDSEEEDTTMTGVKRKIKMDPDSEDEDEQLKYAFITDDDDLGPMGGSGKSAIFQEAASMACPGNPLGVGNAMGTGNAASSSTGQLSSNGFRPGSSASNAEFNPSSVTDDHSYTANSSAFDSSPGGGGGGGGGNNHHPAAIVGSSLPFINVEPPLSEEDYNFALEASEGIADLFDEDILI